MSCLVILKIVPPTLKLDRHRTSQKLNVESIISGIIDSENDFRFLEQADASIRIVMIVVDD